MADDHFERWSATYDNHWMQWLLFRPVHAAILSALEGAAAPDAVLDIGCGTGALLRRIGARWPAARLAGVDAAAGMAAQARRLCPGCDIRQGCAESLPWPDASFDLVLTSVSFHHWRDKRAGIGEAGRVLRGRGRFVLADVRGDGLTGWVPRLAARLARSDEEFLPDVEIVRYMAAARLGETRVAPLLVGFRMISGAKDPE